jgi:hypothetical protein
LRLKFVLPQYGQGRKAIWTAVNPHTGKRRIDEAFPHELRSNTSENEMFIRFKNGATWRVVGSDKYDATVGSPPYGIVFSEWALSNPLGLSRANPRRKRWLGAVHHDEPRPQSRPLHAQDGSEGAGLVCRGASRVRHRRYDGRGRSRSGLSPKKKPARKPDGLVGPQLPAAMPFSRRRRGKET